MSFITYLNDINISNSIILGDFNFNYISSLFPHTEYISIDNIDIVLVILMIHYQMFWLLLLL